VVIWKLKTEIWG